MNNLYIKISIPKPKHFNNDFPIHYYISDHLEINYVKSLLINNNIDFINVEHNYFPQIPKRYIHIFSLDELISYLKSIQQGKETMLLNATSQPKIPEAKPCKPYPKLIISKSYKFILLATSKGIPSNKQIHFTPTYFGTVVQGNEYQSLGAYSDCWDGDGFEDWEGTITLTQK